MEKHIIIGAGPAGLTAAYQLAKKDKEILILEADPTYVGGIARTVEYKGNRFDIGGHRFYSKNKEINRIWREMLPEDFIEVPRLSRIYYNKKLFPYPIKISETLKGLGLIKSFKICVSYLKSKIFFHRQEESFQDWAVNRFGYELFNIFFKTYTEKVWGISCGDISKDWSAQRIRGLSLFEAVKNALSPFKNNSNIKTLIKTFLYPRLGPGQLWGTVLDHVLKKKNKIEYNKTVTKLIHKDGVMTSVETNDGDVFNGSHFYSTMSLKDFVNALDPPPPFNILNAGNALKYRDFLTVALVVDQSKLFPDNWIYIHDPEVHVCRIQNYKNWSKDMIADQTKTCLGMEYFCNEDDELWKMNDQDLIRLASREIEQIGFARESDCIDGNVVRIQKAYPIYDRDYKRHRDTVKNWMNAYFKNVFPAGRNGLHNYNNMDHSMMTAIISISNMSTGSHEDVWAVNTDDEYAEEDKEKRFWSTMSSVNPPPL